MGLIKKISTSQRTRLVAGLIFATLVFGTLSFLPIGSDGSNYHDLFLNLAASLIIVVSTILVFDKVQESIRSAEWKQVREIALSDFSLLSNQAITYVASPFKISISFIGLTTGQLTDQVAIDKAVEEGLDDMLKRVLALNLEAEMERWSFGQWKELHISLVSVRNEVNDLVVTYQRSLTPVELAGLLKLKHAIRDTLRVMELTPGLFTEQHFDWPRNNNGSLKQTMIRQFASDLRTYFEAARTLRASVTTPIHLPALVAPD